MELHNPIYLSSSLYREWCIFVEMARCSSNKYRNRIFPLQDHHHFHIDWKEQFFNQVWTIHNCKLMCMLLLSLSFNMCLFGSKSQRTQWEVWLFLQDCTAKICCTEYLVPWWYRQTLINRKTVESIQRETGKQACSPLGVMHVFSFHLPH